VPFWVVITCQAAIGLGTLIGGWRIVQTVGSKITRMTPVQGCCASAGGAIMLFVATYLGIPVSTTHTVTGSVIGVGAARKVSAVRWNIAANIVIAWIVTLPASAFVAAVCVMFFLGGSLNDPPVLRPLLDAMVGDQWVERGNSSEFGAFGSDRGFMASRFQMYLVRTLPLVAVLSVAAIA
jgi:Phosphate transporter family